jgi:hypothetical protein
LKKSKFIFTGGTDLPCRPEKIRKKP